MSPLDRLASFAVSLLSRAEPSSSVGAPAMSTPTMGEASHAKPPTMGEATSVPRSSYITMPEGWQNAATGMGQPDTDDAVSTTFFPRRTLSDPELRWIYAQTLANRIINEPILDMLAIGEQEGARAWSYKPYSQSSDAQKAASVVYAQSIETALDILPVTLDCGRTVRGYTRAVADALTWADVFGGALIVLEFDDNAPLSMPPDRPRRILGARVYSRPRVWAQTVYGTGGGTLTGRISSYTIDGAVDVHESRVQRLDGILLDYNATMERGFWGMSRIETFYDQLRRFGMGRASSSNTLKDIATAIYTVTGLSALTSKEGRSKLQDIWGVRHMLKGRYRAIILDSNEKAEFRSPQLAGVPDILQTQQGDLCAASGFPEERLFGRASKGLNSNSDGLTHYYDRIRARRTEQILPLAHDVAIAMMSCTQGPTGGRIVPLGVQFPSIATPDPKDQAETDYKQAQTDSIYIDKGVATVEQVQTRTRARYGG